ncbi:hypothetical protein PIB30_091432 [Stylosanthes scabra]|uniref:Uncharacterized protein n=1 Tax=Stylosanthes scabra TaxID=79078 RepID=A0ABU6WUJ5_9FABA|nr:hypothetical protein [Stylosanthes scabra]
MSRSPYSFIAKNFQQCKEIELRQGLGEVVAMGGVNIRCWRRKVSLLQKLAMRGMGHHRNVIAGCTRCYISQKPLPTRIGSSLVAHSLRLCHCKFFLWLDEHNAKFGWNRDMKIGRKDEDVDDHFGRMDIENMVSLLEEKIDAIENKNSLKMWISVWSLVVVFLSVYVFSGITK